MARLLIVLAVAAVVFTVFSIVDCAVQPDTRHRGVSKGVWVVITLVPVIGGILWWTIGRARPGQERPAPTGPVGPDDDQGFLSAADERIRRLEEELAMLDAEEQFERPARGEDAEDIADLEAQFDGPARGEKDAGDAAASEGDAPAPGDERGDDDADDRRDDRA
ncbi:PLDc N-terminal domain-containing protein [Microbacterium sp. ZXX196]|uniref:PLDc N-terminal domain-containing protein n=1 Tax=Microbacterium sp. ZXX196 TaxID=2609291 RepID=UPI0013268B73|nr:hypothetical protein [Microbacterium sp. ZXX196]